MKEHLESCKSVLHAKATEPYTLNQRIDICRGLLAFLVVSAHALELAWAFDSAGMHALHPWVQRFLIYGAGTGLYYVMGFFIISGYCIQASVSRMSKGNIFPFKLYILARLSRLLPLYYLALGTTVIVEGLVAGHRVPIWANGLNQGVLISQFLVLQNFTETYGSFAPSWSITNEVVYYGLFGGLTALVVPLKIRPASLGIVLCVILGAFMQFVYRAGYHSTVILSTGLLFGLGFNWFLGAQLSLYSDELAQSRLARLLSHGWAAALALTIALWCSQCIHLEVIYILSGISFALLLVRFLSQRTDIAVPATAKARCLPMILGNASYPTYLFHGPMLLVVGSFIKASTLDLSWWSVWLIGACTAILTGCALGYVVERPFMEYRARYLKGQAHLFVISRCEAPSTLGVQQ